MNLLYIICFFIGTSCGDGRVSSPNIKETPLSGISSPAKINLSQNPNGHTIQSRIMLPNGYTRVHVDKNSYEDYLRNLKLKPPLTEVLLYNGGKKSNQDIHAAVIDLPIGTKNLHQCADAIMRLRAEYLWHEKQYDQIHFNFTNGFNVEYTEWMKGRKMVVKGNKTYWDQSNNPSNTYRDFWNYMELIFMYAGTLSLSKELKPVPINKMQIGDVFINGGSPGHAIIVVDMAHNDQGQKIFLLAQSYMPAQETHILKNLNEEISPWYTVTDEETIYTPEWSFSKNDLKRFK